MLFLPERDKTEEDEKAMILADKIIDLRKKNGWSQEELAEKLNVSRQAVSKWEGAQSVPDMGRVVQLSELFNVSTDYLLKDEMEKEEPAQEAAADSAARTVGMEEANAFLKVKEENARRVALGVMLCVLSPVLLLLLAGAQQSGLLAWTENQAVGVGLTALLLLIIPAVGIFVLCNMRVSRYEYLEKEPVETLYGVAGMVRERKEKFQPTHTLQLTLGIVLCAGAVIPLFVSLIFGNEDPFLGAAAVACVLLLAAVGVLLIVRSSMIWGSYQMLLEEGDYAREAKEESKRYGYIGGIYWCLVTAAYLAWSFLGNNCQQSWIIWPVAGVAFGAVYGIARALKKK